LVHVNRGDARREEQDVPVVQQTLVGLDKSDLSGRVQFARHRFWLAVLHAEPVQQVDQPGPASILDASLALNPGTDFARCPQQCLVDPGFQPGLLLVAQAAGAASVAETSQSFDPIILTKSTPSANGIVTQQQNLGGGRVTHAIIQQYERVGAPRETVSCRPVAGQFDQVLPRLGVEETSVAHTGLVEFSSGRFARGKFGFSQSRGIP
jgi:hypothetical protein